MTRTAKRVTLWLSAALLCAAAAVYAMLVWTALHSFASGGEVARARLLLEHGARDDVQATNGWTPLDIARRALTRRPDASRAAERVRLLEATDRSPSVPSR